MRELPILMNGDMVRAILAGTKTQTRRPVKAMPPQPNADCHPRQKQRHPAPYFDAYCGQRKTESNPRGMSDEWCWWQVDDRQCLPSIRCPFGQPGDRLWVREPGRVVNISQTEEESVYFTVEYLADKARRGFHLPERFDPQETNVWPSWVKEGRGIPNGIFREAARIHLEIVSVRVERLEDITIANAQAEGFSGHGAIIPFIQNWERIYGRRGLGCDAKPWVWVVEFKRTEASA